MIDFYIKQFSNYSTSALSESTYSQEDLVSVAVCSTPAASLLIGQAQILVLSSHSEWRKKIAIELVHGMDPRLAKNALRNIFPSSAISCQEPRAGTAALQSSKKMNFVKRFIQWEWKLWSA